MKTSELWFFGLLINICLSGVFYYIDFIDGVWLMNIPIIFFAAKGFRNQKAEEDLK